MTAKLVAPDHPLLTRGCHLIPEEDSEWDLLKTFVETDLIPAVVQHRGAGMAANQLGMPIRVFVINHGGRQIVCVNPSIISHSDDKETGVEGCLSLPGVRVPKARWTRIRVRYWTLERGLKEHYMSGMQARIFQHELDHLNGILITGGSNADS